MAKGLQEILGGKNLTGVIQGVQSGLPNPLGDRIPALFRATNRAIGDKATYIRTTGQRVGAARADYGAPAKVVSGVSMSEVGVTLIHTFESMVHNTVQLQNILGLNGGQAAELSAEQIDIQATEFRRRFDNLRQNAVYSMLSKGNIWFDSAGNLLPTSSGAAVTINYSVPATQQNQANSIINASWATSTTDIIGQMNQIKKVNAQTTGRRLKYAVYGANIPSYIGKNDAAKNAINGVPAQSAQLYNTGEVPDGFCGLTWVPAYEAFSYSAAGTATTWVGDDAVIMFPEVDTSWYKFIEGSFPVPRSYQPKATAEEAVNDLEIVYGMFGYGQVESNPPQIVQYGGDTFLPVLGTGNDLWILDVTP